MKRFYLTLDSCRVSSLQYQLSNLLANSTVFLFFYLLLLMILSISNGAILDIRYDPGSQFLILILGILAQVSFSQFLALFFRDPNVSLGVYLLFVEYYSSFLFDAFFFCGFFFPNMFFCFSLSAQLASQRESRVVHSGVDISTPFQALTLFLQTLLYFILTSQLDKLKRGSLCSKSSAPKRKDPMIDPVPICVSL